MPLTLLDPQNLVFLAPFAAGLLLALLTMATGAMHGAHGHAGHGHVGHGHLGHGTGAAHGGGHAHGGSAHATGHASHSHTASHHPQNGAARPTGQSSAAPAISLGYLLAAFTGLNQAPLAVLLWTFLIGWGFCGFWSRYLFHLPLGVAVPVAGVGGYLVARGAAVLVSRLMPPDTTSAVMREQLLGRTGRAVFPVTDTGGRVHVYDQFGTLHTESCRLEKGQSPIEKGCEVLLIDYDDQRRLFLVERMTPATVTTSAAARSMQ